MTVLPLLPKIAGAVIAPSSFPFHSQDLVLLATGIRPAVVTWPIQ
jgi:hypothetical protein